MKRFVVRKTNFTNKGFLKGNKNQIKYGVICCARGWVGVLSNCNIGLASQLSAITLCGTCTQGTPSGPRDMHAP